MTILWGNEERDMFYNHFLGRGIGVELKPAKSTPYDTNPTLIQEQIELSVTNGRGYLGLNDSFDVVNRFSYVPKVTLMDALERGLVPLYLDGPRDNGVGYGIISKNPCGEIPLGESSPVYIPTREREPTLLEKVEMIQHFKTINPRGCFTDGGDDFDHPVSGNSWLRERPYLPDRGLRSPILH